MWILNRIKLYFFKLAIARELEQKPAPERSFVNLQTAQNITVIFNATKTEDVITVTQFVDSLKNLGKNVEMLGFENKKPKKDVQEQPHLFNKSHTNWFDKPIGEKIAAFKKRQPDVLICAFERECLPLEYLAAVSLAKYRVGKYFSKNIANYELMINVEKKQNLQYLLNQFTHFLKVINTHNG